MKRCCVFAVDFKPRIVGGINVMPNHGKAGGAPTWLRLGDGTTATTFPTPLAGFGASFTGTQYVDTGVVDRYERTDQFSLYFYGFLRTRTQQVISSMLGTNNYRGIALEQIATRIYHWNSSQFFTSNANLFYANASAAFAQTKSICVTYAGVPNNVASSAIYSNGSLLTVVKAGDTISDSVKSGQQFVLGARSNSASARESQIIGTAYAFGIFDGLLHPRDIYELDTLVKAGIR